MRKWNAKTWSLFGGFAIVGLVAILLLSGAFRQDQDEGNQELSPSPTPSAEQPVAVNDIKVKDRSIPSASPQTPAPSVVVPEITEQPSITESPILNPAATKQHVEVPITKTETAKPTEPPKPKAEATSKPQSPASTPVYSEKETEPNKQAANPKAGEKNDKGQVWVPGFGWIEDHGGGVQKIETGNDGDINKQIGIMD